MYKHYLKSAIRTLWNNKGNTVINIIGISIGLACCIIISLHVYQEFSFDKFHKDADRIYQVCYQLKENDKTEISYLHPFELSEKMKEEIPPIENITAFKFAWNTTLKYNNQYYQELLAFAEPDFFNIFNYKLLTGDSKTLLTSPNDIVITSVLASKLIGQDQNYDALIGKTIEFPNNLDKKVFIISGVLDKLPANSSMQFAMLMPFDYQTYFSQSNNTYGNTALFLKVKENTTFSQLLKISTPIIKTFYAEKIKELQDNNILTKTSDCFLPVFLPLSKIHLNSPFYDDYINQGNKTNLYTLIGIGALILFIACCNFILLTLGQVMKRTKYIGIQKVTGAKNGTIFRYFFTEVNVLVFIAFIIALLLNFQFLPLYAKLANTRIETDLISNPVIILILISIYLLIVMVYSLAPVLFFSNSKPAMLFQKKSTNKSLNKLPLAFVTLQYGLSIFLIICSLFIASQVNFMKHKSLGFTSENVLYIPVTDMPSNQRLAFRDQLKNNPGIINVTATNMNFIYGRNSTLIEKENGEHVKVRLIRADENYLQTLDLHLTQGRNFLAENMNEKDRNLIVNEKFLASMDLKGDPIGQTFKVPGESLSVTILGVIRDFHFDSMKDNLLPMALTVIQKPGNIQYLFVKTHGKSISDVIAYINKTWDQMVPDRKAQISFWDKRLEARYYDEERWSQIVTYASVLSIFITSLGLFGLTILIINKKTKEIGIRKVNGARISEVLMMLNQEFVKWVIISFIIATPVAWFAMHKWLENFAYKTALSWWIFALAGLLALGIALLTVSWQSWRAARRNPVEALRCE